MNTKKMTKEQCLETIELLKKQIEFNNKLNAFVRKFRKEHSIKRPYEKGQKVEDGFNGYWDTPTPEMVRAMNSIMDGTLLGDVSWMPEQMKLKYYADTSAIFGQIYSIAVNTYHLKDLHDCEKFLKTLEVANNNTEEENDLFKVERNTETNRINLYFDGIPEESVRAVIKHNGFRWSPNYGCWTRQLTDEAEKSLSRIKRELNLTNN